MVQKNATASANERLARQINQEARRNPSSPYGGKLVGIAHGQVVVVADQLEEVVRRLRQLEPDPNQTFCLEADLDYAAVQNIWGVP